MTYIMIFGRDDMRQSDFRTAVPANPIQLFFDSCLD